MTGFFVGLFSFVTAGMGLGGGMLLIPLLELLCAVPVSEGRIICLIAYIPASIVSFVVAYKKRLISTKALWFIPLGVAGAVVGSKIQTGDFFNKIYGGFLIAFGIYMLIGALNIKKQ